MINATNSKVTPYQSIRGADFCNKPLPSLPKEIAAFPQITARYSLLKREHEKLLQLFGGNSEAAEKDVRMFSITAEAAHLLSQAIFVSQFLTRQHSESEIAGVFKLVDEARKEKPGAQSMAEGNLAYLLEFNDNQLVRSAFVSAFLAGQENGAVLETINRMDKFFYSMGVSSSNSIRYFGAGTKESAHDSGMVGSFYELVQYKMDHPG
jgi:hypothetical protein